jgi:DNA-directed RNA polymerase specialized sigma24 family protein
MNSDKLEKGFDADSDCSRSLLNDEEFIGLKELYARLRLRYDKLEILNELEKEEIFIPVSIFNKKLSSVELICKYLVENKNLSLAKISVLLKRSNKNIWNSYNRGKKKYPQKLEEENSLLIPLNSIVNENFSMLENIVLYLKEIRNFSYHETALMLQRDDRTVWTVYNKIKNKIRKKNENNNK